MIILTLVRGNVAGNMVKHIPHKNYEELNHGVSLKHRAIRKSQCRNQHSKYNHQVARGILAP